MEVENNWQGSSHSNPENERPRTRSRSSGPDSQGLGLLAVGEGLPKIDSNPGSPATSPKDRLVDLLDQVEMHVERLRRDALKLEEEKDTLMSTLDTLRNSDMMVQLSESDRDDIHHYSEVIISRCHTVEVLVKTTRDQTQEESLHQVNSFIDSLVVSLQTDPFNTKTRCLSFMNACSSHAQGASDKKFELAILGCTLDDQKRVKKRLQGLLDYIDKITNRVVST